MFVLSVLLDVESFLTIGDTNDVLLLSSETLGDVVNPAKTRRKEFDVGHFFARSLGAFRAISFCFLSLLLPSSSRYQLTSVLLDLVTIMAAEGDRLGECNCLPGGKCGERLFFFVLFEN